MEQVVQFGIAMAATRPYKSKLFNFLNRQSIRWSDRLAQTARRLKITVEWGTQIAVYPLYLLVQASRVATRQLAAAQTQKQADQLAIAAGSVPASAEALIETLTQSAPETTTTPLQGITCDLTSRKIFFVDRQNTLVEPEQSQESLQKQISYHLGTLNYVKRQQQRLSQENLSPRILPPVQLHNPTLLPPVRWLLQGISWLEQSPVAIAIDLFGESHWRTAVIPLEIYSPSFLPPIPLDPLLEPLDDRVASLEAKIFKLAPRNSTSPNPLLQKLFHRFLPNNPSADVPESSVPPTQPWLQWTDLFREKEPHQTPQLPQSAPIPPLDPQALTKQITQDLHQPTALSKPDQPPSHEFTPAQPPPPSDLAPPPPVEIVSSQQRTTDNTIEAKPEWLETKALSIGYDEHFLERLLKKVDQIMAWVENTVAKLLAKIRP